MMRNAYDGNPSKEIKLKNKNLKDKGLLLVTIVFFLIVNTSYYWEGKLGFWTLIIFLLLTIIFIGLVIALIRQIILAIKEDYINKKRYLNIGLLVLVLTLVFFKPFGLINFDKFEGENILVAQREGAANCITTFKLKDDYTFREKNICFGVTEIKGMYRITNDTIYFIDVIRGKQEDIRYKFGVIEKREVYTENPYALKLFKDKSDTVGFRYFILKNELNIKPIKDSNS